MSFIRLYNVKEYFPKYEIAGISEKLAGDVLVENGSVLTSLKSHHVEDPHLMNSLFLTRLPHPGGVDLRTCQELEYRPPASSPAMHARVCVCLELTPQTRMALLLHSPQRSFAPGLVTPGAIRSVTMRRSSPVTQTLAQWQATRVYKGKNQAERRK